MVRHGVSNHYSQITDNQTIKFVHDNLPKFRHNGLLRGESIGRRFSLTKGQ